MDDGGVVMKENEQSEWLSWLKALIIALFLVWLVRTFLIIPIEVDGPSMEPTLNNSDYLIAEKVSYRFSDPKRFDIVIFHATADKDYIKRVIGLPGEVVKYKDDQLYINDQLIEEPYLKEHLAQRQSESNYTADFSLTEDILGQHETIPAGYYLVLGDNRSNSTDSRSNLVGLVSEEDIIGQARFIYWPFKRVGLVN